MNPACTPACSYLPGPPLLQVCSAGEGRREGGAGSRGDGPAQHRGPAGRPGAAFGLPLENKELWKGRTCVPHIFSIRHQLVSSGVKCTFPLFRGGPVNPSLSDPSGSFGLFRELGSCGPVPLLLGFPRVPLGGRPPKSYPALLGSPPKNLLSQHGEIHRWGTKMHPQRSRRENWPSRYVLCVRCPILVLAVLQSLKLMSPLSSAWRLQAQEAT